MLHSRCFFLNRLANLSAFLLVCTKQKILYNNVRRRPFTYGGYLGSYDVQKFFLNRLATLTVVLLVLVIVLIIVVFVLGVD